MRLQVIVVLVYHQPDEAMCQTYVVHYAVVRE
jgi:hypothetical protein